MKSTFTLLAILITLTISAQCDKTPDFNEDCQTSLADFSLLSGAAAEYNALIETYDLNCDGLINQSDVDIIIDNFNQPVCPTIQLFLVNAQTNQDILEITGEGETISGIDLNTPLSIRAEVPSQSESVYFNFLNGQTVRTENVAPYALFGDNNGNYQGQQLTEGSYFIQVKAFSQNNAGGQLIIEEYFNWSFFNL